MKTMTGRMKQHLETVDVRFEKAPDGLSHVSYLGNELIADERTLGECVWAVAKQLGEEAPQ
ncbi:hypothetical protein phiK7A1_132 [Pseudomonas phage phiK7A1]|uniref:Uncharacterized protein n=1 Tax=Pseudomonas phage phiK7A1 TaxID=2759194 RepID=A0A7H0XFY0_9CAUD|nr:hypothetical protein phiK7A1_132 [Pseudomonas phage phiK7A1]